MTNEKGVIVIEQTIHGYRDGHELLASSMQLNSPSRRTMLALSDLSGDGSPTGFESYLTGYPLEDARMYVLARTWYAPEMSRPGCVWTHSLLIRSEDLGCISELGGLLHLFRRPDSTRIPSTLSSLPHQDLEMSSDIHVAIDGASYELIVRLYGQILPVIIFGDNSTRYEDTFVQLWSQQWTPLRRSFAFCTGALELRVVEKRPFDLQVVPRQRERRTRRFANRFSIVTDDDIVRSTGGAARVRDTLLQLPLQGRQVPGQHLGIGEEANQLPTEGAAVQHWPDIIVQDLVYRNPQLRAFVSQYDSDVPAQRSAYRDLVECWALVHSVDAIQTSLRDLTNAIAKAFPVKSEGAVLKRATLGQTSIVRGAKEADLLHELLTLPHAAAFDAEELQVSSRAQRLFRENNRWRASSIAWLLTAKDLNQIGRDWSIFVLQDLGVEDLSGVFAEDRKLFAKLLQDRPVLATSELLWQQPRELQRAAVMVLPSIEGERCRQDAITALVSANAAWLVSALVQELGASVVQQILNGLDQSRRNGRELDEWQWSTQLSGHEGQLIDWLSGVEQAEPWTLAFVVALLGLHSQVLAATASATFQRHLRASIASSEAASVDYAAYCLTIGLRNYDGDAGALAVRAFIPVHEAAIRSQVSRRAWQWLGPSLPRPGWFSLENWDDGEKLRRALIESFLCYRWEPALLCEAVPTEQTRRWIVRYCESFDAGQELLRRAGLRP